MALATGTRLGPYEITGPLGAGGMGEVYRARDTRLGRDVAVKVLPGHLSSSPEVRARFEREARAISSLNHPNICTLHDVGHQEGTDYLVMELVEGETLADRLARGPLPAELVLRHGVEIADALDRAHRSGIVHRDLKPGNVMLTKSGAKLMDFGLARAVSAAGPPADASPDILSQTPTMMQPLTAAGAIVGTYQYMAPEQLEGKEADARTDLFALGAVLYEMATGKKAFEARSQASLITAIMSSEPAPISSVAPMSPPGLERLVRACLAKDPDERVQTAHDVKLQLEWIREAGSQTGAAAAPVGVGHASGAVARRQRERLMWGTVTLALAGTTLWLGVTHWLRSDPSGREASRFTVGAPENVTISPDAAMNAISPDGRSLVFVAADSTGASRLWVRRLDSLVPQPFPETENASLPFWSPDSRFIGFFADGKLKKIPAAGGSPELVCDAPDARGGSWSRDGVIVFAPTAVGPLMRVAASGGDPAQATSLDSTGHETGHRWPCFLPDGKHFLFAAMPARNGTFDIQLGTLGSSRHRRVMKANTAATYAAPGYVVFVRNASLMAQRFDAGRAEMRGEPVPFDGAPPPSNFDAASRASASNTGVVVHVGTGVPNTELRWMNRDGTQADVVPLPPGRYEGLRLSPDGKRLCVERRASASSVDLWLFDLTRPVPTRFTFGPLLSGAPVWSPDGFRIAFTSARSGPQDIYVKPAGGAAAEVLLWTSSALFKIPSQWTPDGRSILFYQPDAETGWDVWMLPAEGGQAPKPYLRGPFNEYAAVVSPDGRWAAYDSDESGRNEVYIQSFPTPSGKYQVSTEGVPGSIAFLVWQSGELFFLGPDGVTLMAAEVRTAPTLQVGAPRKLFRLRPDFVGLDVPPDGRRILVAAPAGQASTGITLIENWTAALKR